MAAFHALGTGVWVREGLENRTGAAAETDPVTIAQRRTGQGQRIAVLGEAAGLAGPPGGDQVVRRSRNPEIVADAAHVVLTRNSRTCTGNLFIDEDVLCEAGVEDFSSYAVIAGEPLIKDFFVDEPRAVP